MYMAIILDRLMNRTSRLEVVLGKGVLKMCSRTPMLKNDFNEAIAIAYCVVLVSLLLTLNIFHTLF